MKTKRNYESEILDIVKTKDWDRARWSNDKNLYLYINNHRDTDENCKIIWEHIRSRKYESEVLEIIETKDWDKAYRPNDINLYNYVRNHRDTDENCKTIWEHISQLNKDHGSEISEIIETKDWDRAKKSNDQSLYAYIFRYKDTDESCKIIWDHIKSRDYESKVLNIIKTEDWDRAKGSNDRDLYGYIHRHKDIDESCRIVWDHIKSRHCTIKDYLLYYFKHGKLTEISNKSLYEWFKNQVKRGNQCCIDIKNLIVAADTYQDPVALETLSLIKNHLEKEGT